MRWKQIKIQPLASLTLAMAMGMAIGMAIATSFYAAPATAAKPTWAGNDSEEHGKSSKKHNKDKKEKKVKKEKAAKNAKTKTKSKEVKRGKHFNDHDNDVVRSYYKDRSRNGKGCPPGLAKKDNGCMPPGQAKKQWTTGEPLPHDVRHHELPHDLLSRLPIPPKGQRYVRILTDILLVDTNTDVVVDAIVDILIP